MKESPTWEASCHSAVLYGNRMFIAVFI